MGINGGSVPAVHEDGKLRWILIMDTTMKKTAMAAAILGVMMFAAVPAALADSTSLAKTFAETNTAISPKASSEVPVGTVMAWPSKNKPSDNWLECNGQTISKADYPELFKV